MMSDFLLGSISIKFQTLLVSGGRGFIRWLKEQGRRDSVITRQTGELANLHSQVHERVCEVWALPEDVLQVCEAWRNKRVEVATGGMAEACQKMTHLWGNLAQAVNLWQ